MTDDIKTRLDTLIENVKKAITSIPKKVSELENDSGYLTEHQSLSEYAKKTEIPTVPTKVSQLENDSGFLTEHQSLTEYAKKSEIPTVPTNVSAFENDAGYLTQHQSLAEYAKKSEVPDIVDYETVTLPDYINQIPISTDSTNSIYNDIGYKTGYLLHTDGSEAEGTGVVVSGFIPVKKGDIIRIKDTAQSSINTTLILALYGSNKATTANIGKTIADMQDNAVYGTITIDGNVMTWDTSSIGYYYWSNFAYLRVTVASSNAIVTVNQPLTESSTQQAVLKSTVKINENNLPQSATKKILDGKKVVCFGDSIFGMTRDDTSAPARAAAFTGATVYNVGFGGCRMSVHPNTGYAAFSMWALADAITTGSYLLQETEVANGQDYFTSQLTKLKAVDFTKIDMIVIHFGTNDFMGNVEIDDTADDDNTSTLCGALRYSLRKIQTTYPKIKIFISLPIYRMWETTGAETYTNTLGKKLTDYCNALNNVARDFNCPVINGYSGLGINSYNDSAYSTDGTHLNTYGLNAFGEYIGGCLISPTAAYLIKEES